MSPAGGGTTLPTTAIERYPRVRQSILSTFDSCSLATKFDLEFRQGWSSHPAATGTLLHRVFHRALVEALAQHDPNGPREIRVPVDVALAVLDEVIRQHDVPMVGDPLDDQVVTVPLRWLAEARIITKTWAAHSVWDVPSIASIERRLSTTLRYPDENGEVVEREFTGRPDVLLIVGDVGTVIDYKTGWGIPSEGKARDAETLASEGDNISEEGYFWMRSYALLVFRKYPRIQRVVLREVYPRYLSGKARDRRGRRINPVRQATITRESLGEIETELSALIERFDRAVTADVWTPSPGSHCSYCPRPEACTIYPTARVEGRLGNLAEAELLAARVQVLDAIIRQGRKALNTWSNLHGPVKIKDAKRPRVYGPVVRQRLMKPNAAAVAQHVAGGGKVEDLYVSEEYVRFGVHTPDEVHPHAAEIAAEETALRDMEKAAAARKTRKAAKR